ncbi:hypothetical protein KKG65_00635, partial [Patescibacteria group bacterium]|nr:hypothetical protein [Patescibacteria group bacterium]
VGIGTTGPSSNLEVWGSTPIVKITQNPGVAGSSLLNIQGAGGAGNTGAIQMVSNYIYSDMANGAILRFGADRVAANAKMVINTTTGNVGIGTTNPSQKLHVAGNCLTGDALLPIRRRKKKKNGQDEDDDENFDHLLCQLDQVRPNDQVLSLNEHLGVLQHATVNALVDTGYQEVYQVTTKSGKTLKVTAGHPLLALINKNKI